MSYFKKENRYWVFKRKHLTSAEDAFFEQIAYRVQKDARPECVVTESGWPNYDAVWKQIEQIVNTGEFTDYRELYQNLEYHKKNTQIVESLKSFVNSHFQMNPFEDEENFADFFEQCMTKLLNKNKRLELDLNNANHYIETHLSKIEAPYVEDFSEVKCTGYYQIDNKTKGLPRVVGTEERLFIMVILDDGQISATLAPGINFSRNYSNFPIKISRRHDEKIWKIIYEVYEPIKET